MPWQSWLVLAVLVLGPVLLWQTAFRGGWVSDQGPVREGVVQVAWCKPTLLPAAGYSCRGRVSWAPESEWVNPKDAKLTRDTEVTVFSASPLKGDAPVASRLWELASKASSRQVEIILPSAAAHRATPLWWNALALGWLVAVVGGLLLAGTVAAIDNRRRARSRATA